MMTDIPKTNRTVSYIMNTMNIVANEFGKQATKYMAIGQPVLKGIMNPLAMKHADLIIPGCGRMKIKVDTRRHLQLIKWK
ncbi:hypothetical protein [Negadavirga shengliensis]|uniref:Uncharacterized protein n=1 Tax=Negadavirga shengliensis TaxID=1389218 RepID=A0ABV9T0G1_9BACT